MTDTFLGAIIQAISDEKQPVAPPLIYESRPSDFMSLNSFKKTLYIRIYREREREREKCVIII